ncbi:MAG TPA: NADH-quinone oxidoreductase subunit C [Bacteroidia bacterium]|jgi:NADH-quinone oxidoreductase subunit C|nr:NADH-quinone oxidoreductase subunit C [Bacteroidia bacterium]
MAVATAENIKTLHDTVLAKLKEKFADDVISSEIDYDFPVFVVKRENIQNILKFLKEDPELNFHFLTTLCGLHYPDNKGKEFGVMYQLHNMPKNFRIRLKAFIPGNDLEISSVTSLWATANWMERQEYDFFGIIFKGHPNLKRILNMDDITFFPMRKEFPLEDPTRDDKDDTMFGR